MKPAILALLVSAILAACAPVTPPDPGPTPSVDAGPDVVSTVFTRGTFDCNLQVVYAERADLIPKVSDCLCSTLTRACMVGLVPPYQSDSVACAVRLVGMDMFVRLTTGMATDREKLIAASSREWIQTEGVGYR